MRRSTIVITISVLSSGVACVAPGQAAESVKIVMGDGHVDGNKIKPYDFSWAQCSLKDGEWQSGPPMSERVTLIGDSMLRLQRTTIVPTGGKQLGSIYFDRASMSPVRMEMQAYGPDGSKMVEISQALSEDGHTATMIKDGVLQSKTGPIHSLMYDGSALGLPLMTLDYSNGTYAFDSSMMSMKGTYKTIARLAGKDSIEFGDVMVETEMVDVEWVHNESGDVYKPGPDESGGRYWLVKKPPDGFPHVPRYQTDTYVVEFVRSVCPAADQPE